VYASIVSRTLEQPSDNPLATTDQTDYKPGDAIVILGSGRAAGATVKLVIPLVRMKGN
jgi:hypothetical protein